MPYKDPERQRAAKCESARRRRARETAAIALTLQGELPEPPTRAVLLLPLLGERAREGNVAAARTLLEEYRRAEVGPDDGFAEFDELAWRRTMNRPEGREE